MIVLLQFLNFALLTMYADGNNKPSAPYYGDIPSNATPVSPSNVQPIMVQGYATELQYQPPIVDNQRNFLEFMGRYEINQRYFSSLSKLNQYRSIIICDDSGSMSQIADPDTGSMIKRWDELQTDIKI